jgi:predicted metal-dependent HD superfamily phosphohydrolase
VASSLIVLFTRKRNIGRRLAVIDEASVRALFELRVNEAREAWGGLLRLHLGGINGGGDPGSTAFLIEASYSTPARFYHDLGHALEITRLCLLLEAGLEGAGGPRLHEEDRRSMILAALGHDAIYEAGRGDNEERSAIFCQELALGLGLSRPCAVLAAGLVRSTVHDGREPASMSEAILRDADLSILASPPAIYARYSQLIRREAEAAGEDRFEPRRRGFLASFLSRDRLFFLEGYGPLLEAAARRNMEAELRGLDPEPGTAARMSGLC